MRPLRAWVLRFTGMFHKERRDQELAAEMESHLQMHIDDNIRADMTAAEARRQALIKLGGIESAKESYRERRGIPVLETLWQDVRFGLRMLRKNPGFTAVAILTLAIGIGANAAIFSMVDWLILRPLPVKDPQQLTYLVVQRTDGRYVNGFSYPNFEDIRKQTSSVFSDLAGLQPFQMDGLSVDGNTAPIWTNYVTGDFFEMMGIRPALGRFILPSEGKVAGADPVLVISYSCWQSRFGGDPNVIGKEVSVNGHPVKIIGVAPKGFHGALAILDTQGFLPLGMAASNLVNKPDFLSDRENAVDLFIVARLRPEVSLAQAQPVLDVVAKRLALQYPKIDEWKSMRASALGAAPPSASPSSPVPMIGGIFLFLAGLVLLLACVNIANLLLVRAGVRAREMAVRSALGAARSRLTRQLLTESILLALFGCAGGIVLGIAASRALGSISVGSAIPVVLDLGFSWRVFAYAIGAALLTGIVVGIVPALRASRANLSEVLHEGGRTSSAGRQRLRSVLVVAEVGGSLTLLIVAGLFVRSLQMVQHVDLGFEPSHVLNISMDPHEAGYDETQGGQFLRDLLQRVQDVPGVQSASIAATVPMGLYSEGSSLKVDGYQPTKGQEGPGAGFNAVSSGYFATMRIPLLRGRSFLDSDNQTSQRVVIINEAMAKEFWPGGDPIGRSFALTEDPEHPVQVVGIAKNSRTGSLADTVGPYFYLPFDQKYRQPATLQIRTTAADPRTIIHEVLGIIRNIEPAMPVFDVQTMTEALGTLNGLLLFQMGAGLAGALGLLGLLLAIIGVYGVVSYAASQRTHEIGIRMALGARPAGILKMIFRQGLVIVVLGVIVGIALAAAISQVVGNLLVGVAPLDPLTYASASLVLALVALAACYFPARRAMRVDPMVALRYE